MSSNDRRRTANAGQEPSASSRAPKVELDANLDMHFADNEAMPPECENMLPLHKHIARSAYGKMRKTAVADLMGVSVDYVKSTLDRDDVKAYMRYLTTRLEDHFVTVTSNIERAMLKALDAKLAILEFSDDDRLVDKVASDILDRGGAKAPDRVVVSTNTVFTAEDIRAMRRASDAIEDVLDG